MNGQDAGRDQGAAAAEHAFAERGTAAAAAPVRVDRCAVQDYRKAITAHYLACAITFGEKREDCDTLWGWHLEVPADLVSKALENYTGDVWLDKERGVYVIGAMPKE